MDCYKAMYYKLFNKMTDIASEIQAVQKQTEEMFMSLTEEDKQEVEMILKQKG